MIVDTYEIEKIFDRFIGVDHLHLNEFMNEDNPTMEFMAKYFYDNLSSIKFKSGEFYDYKSL